MPIDPEDLKEPEGGIHFVKNKGGEPAPAQAEICAVCRSPATCCTRLYVPPSALSINAGADDVSVLMAGVYFCDRHYFLLLDGDLKLKPEARAKFITQEVMAAISFEFRKRNAYPNFDKATAGRVPANDPDYRRGQTAVQVARKAQ